MSDQSAEDGGDPGGETPQTLRFARIENTYDLGHLQSGFALAGLAASDEEARALVAGMLPVRPLGNVPNDRPGRAAGWSFMSP